MPRYAEPVDYDTEEKTEANLDAEYRIREATSHVAGYANRALTLAHPDSAEESWQEALQGRNLGPRFGSDRQSVVAMAMFLYSDDEETLQLIKDRAGVHSADCYFNVNPMSY